MHFITLAVAFFGLASASIVTPDSVGSPVIPSNYHWRVTKWEAGCSGSICKYSCHIQAPPRKDGGIKLPGFKARCSAKATGFFSACHILSSTDSADVAAMLVPTKHANGPGVVSEKMGVSLSFKNANGVTYNFTGYHQAEYNRGRPGGRNFAVQPTEASLG